MSSIEKVGEQEGIAEVPNVESPLLMVDVEPVHIDGLSTEPDDGENPNNHRGWEYDRYVASYINHPRNRPNVRYPRDCRGFEVDRLKPFNATRAAASEDEAALFVAYMKQFPLISTLTHQQSLTRNFQRGKLADDRLRDHNIILDAEEKRRLRIEAIDGAGSFQTMYECNLKLVMNLAAKQEFSSSYSIGDAIGDGCIGLRRAIQKYEPEKGFKFSTYAVWWIKQSIQRGRNPVAYGTAISDRAFEDLSRVVNDVDKVEEKGGRVTVSELIEMGHDPLDIRATNLFFKLGRSSLDASLGNRDDATLADIIADSEGLDTEYSTLSRIDSSVLVSELMESLTDVSDLEIVSLMDGVVYPGVDYGKLISFNGSKPAPLGEYLIKIRQGEFSYSHKELCEVFGKSREIVRALQDRVHAVMLNAVSLEAIRERGGISSEQMDDLTAFMSFKGFKGRGMVSNEVKDKAKKYSVNSVNTLRSFDVDFIDVLFQTMNVVKHRNDLDDSTMTNMESWLRLRFGYIPESDIPLSTRMAKTLFGFNSNKVVVIESIYLAVLSGTWGKIPESFTS